MKELQELIELNNQANQQMKKNSYSGLFYHGKPVQDILYREPGKTERISRLRRLKKLEYGKLTSPVKKKLYPDKVFHQGVNWLNQL